MSSKIKNILVSGDSRTRQAKANISLSIICKGLSFLISFLLVPLTITFVDDTRYGIWLTLNSIISWISVFDLGFSNGFRNKFAEAKALGNDELARKYVSTTYFFISILFLLLFVLLLIINNYLSWGQILNIPTLMDEELRSVIAIMLFSFSVTMSLNTITILLSADQRSGIASIITLLGSILTLVVTFILVKVNTQGSLFTLAVVMVICPLLVLIIANVFFFRKDYSAYAPNLSFFDSKLIKEIFFLGSKFFIIQVCYIIIFQAINLIISRILGPESVTQYQVTFRYMNILAVIISIMATTYWSATTEAYAKKEYKWIEKSYKNLLKMWMVCSACGLVMVVSSPVVYKIWLGDRVDLNINLTLLMFFYVISSSLAGIPLNIINGIGKISFQTILYVLISIVAIPVLKYACSHYGLYGILVVCTLIYVILFVFAHIQLNKLINKIAKGIWNK